MLIPSPRGFINTNQIVEILTGVQDIMFVDIAHFMPYDSLRLTKQYGTEARLVRMSNRSEHLYIENRQGWRELSDFLESEKDSYDTGRQ